VEGFTASNCCFLHITRFDLTNAAQGDRCLFYILGSQRKTISHRTGKGWLIAVECDRLSQDTLETFQKCHAFDWRVGRNSLAVLQHTVSS
jgi:hypothetical protein